MNDVIKVLQQVSDTCGVTKYCARCDMFNDDTGVCVFADMPYLWDFEKLEEVLKEGAKMDEYIDKVVLEEDNDGYVDKLFCEYRFKFCPECGAKVRC